MAISRSQLAGGPAHLTRGAVSFHLAEDASLSFEKETVDIESLAFGPLDKRYTNALVKASGRPLTWENLTTYFPADYLTPVKGKLIPTGVDTPLAYNAVNGDLFTITCAVLTQMPEIFLGATEPIMGALEFTGIIGDAMAPATAGSYYTKLTGQTYTPLAVDYTKLKRETYSAAFGTVSGMTTIETLDGWRISHQLSLEPVAPNGRTLAYKLLGYRAVARCIPVGPTASQLLAQLKIEGVAHGSSLSTDANDLTIAGTSVTVVVKNCALVDLSLEFAGVKPRVGEIGFATIPAAATGALGAVLVLT